MAENDLGRNVRHLCSRYKSISEVCRRLDINRQQFNRYLAGQQTPNLYTLSRIAEFFGVTVDEIQLPHRAFCEQVDRYRSATVPKPVMERIGRLLKKPMPQLEEFQGYYYRYYYSFAFRGMVIRTLLRLQREGDLYVSRHIERIPRSDAPVSIPVTFKYDGVVLYISGRLFLLESESMLDSTVCEAILAPVVRPGTRLLSGVQCSITTGTGNEPTCTRVVLEFLGQSIDARSVMRDCGLYEPTDDAIDPAILKLIKNDNRADAHTFKARAI